MARDLFDFFVRQLAPDSQLRLKTPVRIGVVGIKNETNEPWVGDSADMVLTRIQTILVRAFMRQSEAGLPAVRFITMRTDVLKEINDQRDKMAAGTVVPKNLGKLYGADFFLTGVYHAHDKVASNRRMVTTQMTFQLVDAVTAESTWENVYDVKTLTRR